MMDAIASARVSEFMSSYVDSDGPPPPSDPGHHATLEQSLAEFRLVSEDLARVQAMLGEIGSQRGFIQWLNDRIRVAEEQGQDTYMLRWDRAVAGAKIRDLQERLPGVLGPSLEARLGASRQAFRLDYLDSGVLGSAAKWAGDDAAIQDALDGMLVPDNDQAVVNQYLYSLGELQRNIRWLVQALDTGGPLATSPQRLQHEATLSYWQRLAGEHKACVMGILSGTVDASRVDPLPWTRQAMDPAAMRPPVGTTERRIFQMAEDAAWLDSLGREARATEDALAALAALDAQDKRQKGGRAQGEQGEERSAQRHALIQQAQLLHECMAAVQARLRTTHPAAPPGEEDLRQADLRVANAQRKLEALNAGSPGGTSQALPLRPGDEALYNEVLPALRQALPSLQRSYDAVAAMTERLASMLVVPRGFRLSDTQRDELALLASQRAVLLEQQQLIREELSALKALIDQTALAQRQGRPFDHEAFLTLDTAREAARSARVQGEEARQGALTTPPPTFVAWKQNVRSSQSRAQTVTSNYLLSPEVNASTRAQVAADRAALAELRKGLATRETSIQQTEGRLALLTRAGATAADKADIPSEQARLQALKSLRNALLNRLNVLEDRLSAGQGLLTSSSERTVVNPQEDIAQATAALPDAWLEQLRQERQLAQAEWTAAQRQLSRLQGTAGTANATLGEAEKLLAYRAAAKAYTAARVAAVEVDRGLRGGPSTLETAGQTLASMREAMQAAYFMLAQVRLVYLSDSLNSQLRAERQRGASTETLQRLRRQLDAVQVTWPRDVTPYPQAPAAMAAAVQARYGDELPE